MCGRYYVDDETAREIEKLVRKLDQRMKGSGKKDVFPSQKAVVLCEGLRGLYARQMTWGFPGYDHKGMIINARAESALDKKTFQDSIRHNRCVIPAKGFYEWNKSREKSAFERTDAPVLFMAGCYQLFQDQEHFVILTTKANPSVSPVHERMPLILDRGEIDQWLCDDSAAEGFLKKVPVLLKRETEYEQLQLFE